MSEDIVLLASLLRNTRVRLVLSPEYGTIAQIRNDVKYQLNRQSYPWPSIQQWAPHDVPSKLSLILAHEVLKDGRTRLKTVEAASTGPQQGTRAPTNNANAHDELEFDSSQAVITVTSAPSSFDNATAHSAYSMPRRCSTAPPSLRTETDQLQVDRSLGATTKTTPIAALVPPPSIRIKQQDLASSQTRDRVQERTKTESGVETAAVHRASVAPRRDQFTLPVQHRPTMIDLTSDDDGGAEVIDLTGDDQIAAPSHARAVVGKQHARIPTQSVNMPTRGPFVPDSFTNVLPTGRRPMRLQPKRAAAKDVNFVEQTIYTASDSDYDPRKDEEGVKEQSTSVRDTTGSSRKRGVAETGNRDDGPKKRVAIGPVDAEDAGRPDPHRTANRFDSLSDRLKNFMVCLPRIWQGDGNMMIISFPTPRSGAEMDIDLDGK